MPAVSLLVLAVLAQPVQHRVEVLGQGGDAFWSARARGSDLWERVRGDVQLEVRCPAEGAPSAELSLHLTRGAERWSVELSALRSSSLLIDGDLPGPGGLVHAAVALGGTARVTRAGELVSDSVTLRAVALTTGYHADDGTFRTLPAGRSGDLELLVQLDGLPGLDTLDLGFEYPQMRLDGRLLSAAPLADATAPAWPGALRGTGVGGSGSDSARVLYGSVPPLPPPPPSSQAGAMLQLPPTPSPANAAPAGPLPSTPPPANAAPGTALPTTPTPASDAPLLPPTPAPANGAPGMAPPATPPPANSSPALPLPTTPSTAPGPAHGGTTAPGPTWLPSPTPPSPVPDAPLRETEGTRFARADTKIDPSGQASTVRLRVRLRARTLDLSRNVARIALADRG